MFAETKDGIRISLFVQPKASKNEIIGPHNGALKIRITAPPVDGKANECIVEFLAKKIGVPKRQVEILKGETGRTKSVLIKGASLAQVTEALAYSKDEI